jgi:GNAT superfamily N-acetyltransferase
MFFSRETVQNPNLSGIFMSNYASYRWWKAGEIQKMWPENFLKEREPFCVSACSRFLKMSYFFDKMWVLTSNGRVVSSVLFQSGQTLFPVFGEQIDIKIPIYMHRVLKNSQIHAIQGLKADTDMMERIMGSLGIFSTEHIDFDLMSLDSSDGLHLFNKVPTGVSLRVPTRNDIDALLPIQAAYEKEEVLTPGAVFNAPLCRFLLENILKNEKILIATKADRIIGKINTNAASYSRYQIGGVYVVPEFRGRGIAAAMTSIFCDSLLQEGRGVTLFVKKQNERAQAVYRKIGFEKTADYRIVYI